ncbi:ATP-binding protein [Shewanella gaetbuli]|uniref:histidine kinase n=1 Tax=Shewanella gaetbuli TaxID=220752 RepID=A0A9X1ZI16_9GAMM|nr:ATP-binding protein [Shewanella gaetbuli]MCL1141896.1 ATP-binding protein [Shewanella gaetbuli]
MKRLFISLYLLLSLSFLGIGWTLDSLWQTHIEDNVDVNAPLIALALILAEHPEDERQAILDKISKDHDFPIKLLQKNQIALQGNVALEHNNVLTTVTDDEHQSQFIAVGNQVLIAGPFDIDPRGKIRGIFTIIFYFSLALVALVWVWPLSKDLNILKIATKKFGQANWNTRIDLPASSQVYPLAETFNDMAHHISSLIDNQKHLTNAVSHEIRTPLARLKFALALLPQYCQPQSDVDKRNDFLQEMNTDIQEMETLLKELLTYASLETTQVEPVLEKCDLIGISQQLILRLEGLSQHPITLNYTQGFEQIFIKGENSFVERAIQNLIINAQRFAKHAITIDIDYGQDNIQLIVSNDGPMVALEDQPHLFEAFYRSQSKKQGNKGHGLGLAIIKRIMHRHKGSVKLESTPKKTQFILTWPTPK